MHKWGGNFEYFNDVAKAADEIGDFCMKWGRISVSQTKEKFGQARVYCNFGAAQLHSLTHPGYHYSRYPQWLWKFDCLYISKFFRLIHLDTPLVWWQKYVYRAAYSRAIKKYPHIKTEILTGADFPCLVNKLFLS